MKLKDLISPKWKNSNPAVRLKAVKAIDNGDFDLLQKILFTDGEAGIRHAVIQKISNEELLSKVASTDLDKGVRNSALSKLNKLYSERIIALNDNNERLVILNLIDDEDVLSSLASQVDNPEFRISIINKISAPGRLCAMTESNCGVKPGKAIIEKIDDVKFLERISKKASGKKIRKMALEKIDSLKPVTKVLNDKINPDDHEITESETLCVILKAHCSSTNIATIEDSIKKAEILLDKIIKDTTHPAINQIVSAIEDLRQHYTGLKKTAATTLEYQTLISEIKSISCQISFRDEDKNKAETINTKWNAIPDNNIDKSQYESLYSDFDKELSAFREKSSLFFKQQEEEQNKLQSLQRLCKKAESLVETNIIETLGKDLKTIEDEWNSIYSESDKANTIRKQFEAILTSYREIISAGIEAEKLKTDTIIKDLLEKVRKASEENGNALFKAASIVKVSISKWQTFNNIDLKIENEFNQLYEIFSDKLDAHKKNKDWEQWANLSLKTELCVKAEQISEAAQKATELYGFADIIRETQKNWKNIGPVSKDKSDGIWDRFRLACDTVFTLCLNEKTTLLNTIKDTVELPNFNEASRIIIETQQQWKKLGTLPLSLEKDIRDEFNHICNSFFEKKREFIQQKDNERDTNLNLKLTLCEKAESFADAAVDNGTTEYFKKLQSDWKKIGSVPRNQSDIIWERFSLACNTYFDTLEKSKPENLQIKKDLLSEAESILDTSRNGSDIWEACKRTITIQKTWNKTGPVHKEEADTLWKQFRTVCDDIFSIREEAREELSNDYEKNRLEKEQLIINAEAITTSDDWAATAVELKNIQDTWKSLGAAARKDEQELWTRFRQVNDSFFNRRRDHFNIRDTKRNENLCIKENLCLTLELLAKVAMDKADLEYNKDVPLAEQLSKARDLRAGIVIPGDEKATRANIVQKVKDIQTEWKQTGPVPSGKDSILWERYKIAGDLFYSK